MKRRRGQTSESPSPAEDGVASARLDAIFMSYLRPAILALTTALLVSTPLIASESVVSEGTFATWHVMWLAVACISLIGSAFFTSNEKRWSWADLLVVVLVGWHVVSALHCDGNLRQAWNATWQWGAYGALAIILRQQLTSAKETRALVVVLLALGLAVSLHASYQYAVVQPQLRAQFEKDPDKVFERMGISAEPGSPTRSHAENRIKSLEPNAEFALTNSLAGFLLPWLLLALGIAFWTVQKEVDWKIIGTLIAVALFIFGVLLLTKSRTAVLAAAGGCVLILLYGRRSGWQLDWRWPAGIAAAALVLGLVAVAAKGLDAKVLSESPKSLLYRIEYWRATAALIATEPLYGVGPGNFQERYVNYKLPEASETVADPHNFLLEVWSTAGTPALLALVGLMAVTAWQVSRRSAVVSGEPPAETNYEKKSAVEELKISHFAIYAGAVLGLLLAGILGFVVFDPLETTRSGALDGGRDSSLGIPIIWLTCFVSLIVCFIGLQDWVNRGELPRSAVVIALLALLVNLLAAGAAIFPGIVNTAWLLWAIALQPDASEETNSAAEPTAAAWSPLWTKIISVAAGFLFLAALLGCYFTEYQPVLKGQMLVLQAVSARNENHHSQAADLINESIAADPWAPMPRRLLADFLLRGWLARPNQRAWGAFLDAMELYEKSSSHHFSMHEERGQWLLLAGRRIKDPDRIKLAAEAYQEAIKCYPNSAFLHAQLASIYAELEKKDDAQREAAEAARLDALCPHIELKLEKRQLYDPPPSPFLRPDGKSPSAAKVVEELSGKSSPQIPSSP